MAYRVPNCRESANSIFKGKGIEEHVYWTVKAEVAWSKWWNGNDYWETAQYCTQTCTSLSKVHRNTWLVIMYNLRIYGEIFDNSLIHLHTISYDFICLCQNELLVSVQNRMRCSWDKFIRHKGLENSWWIYMYPHASRSWPKSRRTHLNRPNMCMRRKLGSPLLITFIMKFGMKLLIHSHISTVQPLKFRMDM